MNNRRAGVLAAFLIPASLVLIVLAMYANTEELPATPSFLVGLVTGMLVVATGALLYLAGREPRNPRR